MSKRIVLYTRSQISRTETEAVILGDVRRTVEDRGDMVVATFVDDGRIIGRGKYAGWRELIAKVDRIDQVAVAEAGDLPGRTVHDLLKTLGTFRDHRVSLYLHREDIDTGSTAFAVLDLIEVYRRARLSAAIRTGQAKALAAGKRIGRPLIPRGVLIRIQTALADGGGVRPTARRFNVSAGSVINVRRTMTTNPGTGAA